MNRKRTVENFVGEKSDKGLMQVVGIALSVGLDFQQRKAGRLERVEGSTEVEILSSSKFCSTSSVLILHLLVGKAGH